MGIDFPGTGFCCEEVIRLFSGELNHWIYLHDTRVHFVADTCVDVLDNRSWFCAMLHWSRAQSLRSYCHRFSIQYSFVTSFVTSHTLVSIHILHNRSQAVNVVTKHRMHHGRRFAAGLRRNPSQCPLPTLFSILCPTNHSMFCPIKWFEGLRFAKMDILHIKGP